jgi:tRNA pseudouridine55 synthase
MPRKPRNIQIYKLICLAYNYPFLLIDITCGRGTYIRTLAADIGQSLCTGAHLWALKRLGVGEYKIEDALAWDKLMTMNRKQIEKYLVPAGDILSFLPQIQVDHKEKEAMTHGRSFMLANNDGKFSLDKTSVLRIQDREGKFLGLGGIVTSNENSLDGEVCIRPSLVMFPS